MLILTRKQNESILIGDDIKITVTHVRGAQVGIGIDAPRDVNIVREEIADYMDEFVDDCLEAQAKKQPTITYR